MDGEHGGEVGGRGGEALRGERRGGPASRSHATGVVATSRSASASCALHASSWPSQHTTPIAMSSKFRCGDNAATCLPPKRRVRQSNTRAPACVPPRRPSGATHGPLAPRSAATPAALRRHMIVPDLPRGGR